MTSRTCSSVSSDRTSPNDVEWRRTQYGVIVGAVERPGDAVRRDLRSGRIPTM
jgi:hypothetical protein